MKKLLTKDSKVIYYDTLIKPSVCQVKEIQGEVALLDNRVKVSIKPNKNNLYPRIENKSLGYAIPWDEENQKLVDASNFYSSFHPQVITKILSDLKENMIGIKGFDLESADKILRIKRLIDKISKI